MNSGGLLSGCYIGFISTEPSHHRWAAGSGKASLTYSAKATTIALCKEAIKIVFKTNEIADELTKKGVLFRTGRNIGNQTRENLRTLKRLDSTLLVLFTESPFDVACL